MARTMPSGQDEGGPGLVNVENAHCTMMNSFPEERHVRNDDRWRELFPLPLCSEAGRPVGTSVSSRRRRARVQQFARETIIQ